MGLGSCRPEIWTITRGFAAAAALHAWVTLAVEAVPSIDELGSRWIDPTAEVSHNAGLGPEQRDLPTLNNFRGSVGIAPEGTRPVDLFGVNSLELPPFAGCGADAVAAPYGCGSLAVDGKLLGAIGTKWAAHEARRRAAPLGSSGVLVQSATRMPFELNGVMWEVNFTNPTDQPARHKVEFRLVSSVKRYATVGTWVYDAPADVGNSTYTVVETEGQKGLVACSSASGSAQHRPACARWAFVGGLQPDEVTAGCSRCQFGVDCDHVKKTASAWHCAGSLVSIAVSPTATFSSLRVPSGGTVTVRVALAIGETELVAAATWGAFAGSDSTFAASWAASHDRWQERWEQAFTPENSFFSGHLPTVDFAHDPEGLGVGVERVFYMSALTVLSQLRTNLPLIGPRVWPNGNGNVGHGSMGIGGSRSWFWDEALTSIMLALLEPALRAPTFQAWLAHDDHPDTKFGHGVGNGYAMDCAPIGSSSCSFDMPTRTRTARPRPRRAVGYGYGGNPEYGFYCYNPWAFYMAISNHLRVNNDSAFLASRAANSSLTVAQALEEIATDFEEYLIPGTHLVDYGPSMDGFSPTYKHVMPGCGQGNNIWMLRDFATLQELRGNASDAARLRGFASALAKDTLDKMYTGEGGRGWFNVIYPVEGDKKSLRVVEMRHVVDFFSVIFGMCGLSDQPCDLSDRVRAELGAWFREESVTKNWIRATSPLCNCSNTWTVSRNNNKRFSRERPAGGVANIAGAFDAFPAYPTCHAGRPDHGSSGAYPSWPAFAVEALCYVDGNCSSAFSILSSFVDSTFEGPFGQAHQVPQLSAPPYTPLNDESAFKPTAGVTRYVAIEGGSFFDAVVRGFFGYHPPPQWAAGTSPQKALEAALVGNANNDRGFRGTLSNLRTPYGLATITSRAGGLSIALQGQS